MILAASLRPSYAAGIILSAIIAMESRPDTVKPIGLIKTNYEVSRVRISSPMIELTIPGRNVLLESLCAMRRSIKATCITNHKQESHALKGQSGKSDGSRLYELEAGLSD